MKDPTLKFRDIDQLFEEIRPKSTKYLEYLKILTSCRECRDSVFRVKYVNFSNRMKPQESKTSPFLFVSSLCWHEQRYGWETIGFNCTPLLNLKRLKLLAVEESTAICLNLQTNYILPEFQCSKHY